MTAITKFNHKLRRLRTNAKAWNKSRRGLPTFLSANKDTMDYLDKVEEQRQLTDLDFYLHQRLQKKKNQTPKWLHHFKMEKKSPNKILYSRSRKYKILSHSGISQHAKKKCMKLLMDNGVEHYDNNKKLDIATLFFQQLFSESSTSDRNFPCLCSTLNKKTFRACVNLSQGKKLSGSSTVHQGTRALGPMDSQTNSTRVSSISYCLIYK